MCSNFYGSDNNLSILLAGSPQMCFLYTVFGRIATNFRDENDQSLQDAPNVALYCRQQDYMRANIIPVRIPSQGR